MLGKTVRLLTVCVLLMAGGLHASAETTVPSESVTVTANKSREMFGKFVKTFAAPAMLTGKIARWERRLCPVVVGQTPNFTTFITQRVKTIALAAGARVNTEASCKPNIEIVFTTTPQGLIDNVRKNDPDYLGYAESAAQIKELATVTRPVQAWYATQTKDLNGMGRIDSTRRTDEGIATPFARSTGNHITEGVHSAFYHIVIVADINRLAGYEAGPMADYIAMLALAQLASLDTCQPLPSIENMMAKGCEAKTGKLTANDIAYLHGLYKMTADTKLLISQKNEIADSMKTSLAAK
jgi:hypothetical protein